MIVNCGFEQEEQGETKMSSNEGVAATNPEDLKALKERMKLIADADPSQYHNEFSLKRFLRAFKTVDAAFQVNLVTLVVCKC